MVTTAGEPLWFLGTLQAGKREHGVIRIAPPPPAADPRGEH
jgi:hypothetical protein